MLTLYSEIYTLYERKLSAQWDRIYQIHCLALKMQHKSIYHNSINDSIAMVPQIRILYVLYVTNIKFGSDAAAYRDQRSFALSKNSHFGLFLSVFDI